MTSARWTKLIRRPRRGLLAAASVGIVALLTCAWVAGIGAPARNGKLLLLARGPAPGAYVYDCEYDKYQPTGANKLNPQTSLTHQDLIVAEIPLVSRERGKILRPEAEWARIIGVSLAPGNSRMKLCYSVCTRLADLVPVQLDSVVSNPGNGTKARAKLLPCFHRFFYHLAQYDTPLGPMMSLMLDGAGEYVYCMYRINHDHGVEWIFSTGYSASLSFVFPGLRVVPECRGTDGVPDILAFQPPVGLVCWRWNGERFVPALPRLRELPLLLGLLLQGYLLWLSVLVALAPAYFVGFRQLMTRAHALALLAWWSIFIGLGTVTPDFMVVSFLAIMLFALFVVAIWIVVTRKPQKLMLGRLYLSILLLVVFSLAFILWLLMLEGYFEVNGIGMP